MSDWTDLLSRADLSRPRRAVASLLADLSCTPWKFDVLWDAWSDVGINEPEYRMLAAELMSGGTPELIATGATVFDDITLFADLAGDATLPTVFPRSAYRAAYLCQRPLLSRNSIDDPPNPPLPVESEQHIERVGFAIRESPEASVDAVTAVFEDAGRRYSARGQPNGNEACRQGAMLFAELSKPEARAMVTSMLRQSTFRLYFSAQEAALANEIALQWHRLFDDFPTNIRIADDQDASTSAAVAELADSFARHRPLRWLIEERPGIPSVVTISTLIRIDSNRAPSSALAFFPTIWIEACQECVILLKKKWTGAPRVPDDMLHNLLDLFVEVSRHTRRQ